MVIPHLYTESNILIPFFQKSLWNTNVNVYYIPRATRASIFRKIEMAPRGYSNFIQLNYLTILLILYMKKKYLGKVRGVPGFALHIHCLLYSIFDVNINIMLFSKLWLYTTHAL